MQLIHKFFIFYPYYKICKPVNLNYGDNFKLFLPTDKMTIAPKMWKSKNQTYMKGNPTNKNIFYHWFCNNEHGR